MYTNNAKQIRESVIPAYERELAGARRAGDKGAIAAIEAELKAARKLAGVDETAMPAASETSSSDTVTTGGEGSADLDRDALKARALELRLEFDSRIPTPKLIKLIEEADASTTDPVDETAMPAASEG